MYCTAVTHCRDFMSAHVTHVDYNYVGYNSAFNTFVPDILTHKLLNLFLSNFFCTWIRDLPYKLLRWSDSLPLPHWRLTMLCTESAA